MALSAVTEAAPVSSDTSEGSGVDCVLISSRTQPLVTFVLYKLPVGACIRISGLWSDMQNNHKVGHALSAYSIFGGGFDLICIISISFSFSYFVCAMPFFFASTF